MRDAVDKEDRDTYEVLMREELMDHQLNLQHSALN